MGFIRRSKCEDLTLQYLDTLYHFAFLLTGENNQAEDLVYQTCLEASRHQPTSLHKTDHKVWLFTTMRNIFLKACPQGSSQFVGSDLKEAGDSWDFPPDGKILKADIERVLYELPYPFRELVVLKQVFGFDYREITQILQCPAETVSSRLRKSRNLLKQKLKVHAQNPSDILRI